MAIYIPNQIHQYGLPGAQRVLGFIGELSNGLRSSGKTEENVCRQMGNSNIWSISGLGQMVKRFSHLSNVCIRFYVINAVYGQMGTSFYHLSKLCAESGQMEK